MGIISLNINECQNENDLPKDLPKDTPEDIFDGIGCVQGDPVKITLKEDAKPFHVNALLRLVTCNRLVNLGISKQQHLYLKTEFNLKTQT